MRNKEPSTISFNKQTHQSRTSRQNYATPLRALKKTTPSRSSRRIRIVLAQSSTLSHIMLRRQRWSGPDHTSSLRKIRQTVWLANCLSLKRNGHTSEAVYKKIKLQHKQSPRIYGYKGNVQLRPTVSCVTTLAYDLSAFLANRKFRFYGDQLSSLPFHHQQREDSGPRNHGVLRRGVIVHQLPNRGYCRSRTTKVREWCKPCRPHDTNTCSDSGLHRLRIEINILTV